MKPQITRVAAVACAALVLGACSSVNVKLWPFGDDKEQNPSRTPPGATAYTCQNGQQMFVRYLDGGAAAWIILPGREFRLGKAGADTGTYSNGSATLAIQDKVATLTDGPGVSYTGCKPAD
jgi:hypothetical protein